MTISKFIQKLNTKKSDISLLDNWAYDPVLSGSDSIGKLDGLISMIPAIIFAASALIVFEVAYSMPLESFYFVPKGYGELEFDFFSFGKAVCIIISCFLMLCCVFAEVCKKNLRIKKLGLFYIPMAVYLFFVLVSYITSDYRLISLIGAPDRFEGTVVLICYMMALFYIMNFTKSESNVKQLVLAVAAISVVLCLIGGLQGIGHDFFLTTIGQKLITRNYSLADGGTLNQLIDEYAAKGKTYLETTSFKETYQTLYNPNNVAFCSALFIPLFGMLCIRSWNKGTNEPLLKKIGLGIIFALVIFNFICSDSAGGLLGIGVIGILAIIIFNKQLLKWKRPLIALFVITLLLIGMNFIRVATELVGSYYNLRDSAKLKSDISINYICTMKDGVQIAIDGKLYGFTFDGFSDGILVTKQLPDGVSLSCVRDESGQRYIQLVTSGFAWNFADTESGYRYLNPVGNLVDLDRVERNQFFFRIPNFISGRGLIWADSIPLLKKTAVKGVGADLFVAYYPHNDYAGRYTAWGPDSVEAIVDKPHNMYLMMGINTGCISLASMLFLYGTYVIQSIKLYRKRDFKNDYLLFAGSGTFLGVTGYLFNGLIYDSTVSTMPLFYSMLGMGIAINEIIKRRDKAGVYSAEE